MAVKLLTTSGNLSTSGGNWVQGDASNLDWTSFSTGTAWIGLNATRTLNVTFANAGTQKGLLLFLMNAYTGTLTIKLFEGAVERTSDVFTLSTLKPCSVSGDVTAYYFPLTDYSVTTAGSTWSYTLLASSSTPQGCTTTADGTDFLYVAFTNSSTTKIGSGDTLVLKQDVTLTMDESLTIAKTQDFQAIQCTNSIFQCLTPAASYTLTASNLWYMGLNTQFLIGTESVPIPYAQRFIIDCSSCTNGQYFFNVPAAANYNSRCKIELWGAENAYMGDQLSADANASQAVVVTTRDLSAIWQNGDVCSIVGKYKPGSVAADIATYTIQSITGTSVTFTGNLDVLAIQGAFVVNDTHAERNCGIKIIGVTGGYLGFPFVYSLAAGKIEHVQMAGIYMQYAAITAMVLSSTNNVTSYWLNTSKYNIFRNIFLSNNVNTYVMNVCGHYMTVSGIYSHQTTSTTVGTVLAIRITGNNMTVSNIMSKNTGISSSYTVGIIGNNATISNVVLSQGSSARTAPSYGLYLSGTGCTATGIYIITCLQNYGLWLNWTASTINTLVISDSGQNSTTDGYDILFAGCSALTINNAKLGTYGPAYLGEINLTEDTLPQILFNNCDVGASVTNLYDNLDLTLAPSYLAFDTYDTTTDDHRIYKVLGYFQSTKTGLGDTTVHTAGGMALRFEPISSTENLTWIFNVPTGNIQSKTMFIGVWCKIASATYYAGTNQLPRLTISYDNGVSTAYAQAAESTDWQLLVVPFTPATTYGQITVTLSGRTDATTTDAYVYWDDFSVAYPPNTSLDLGAMDLWANALPITPPIAIPISAKTVSSAVWEELTASHVTASTFGKSVGKLKNPSLLIDGEIIA